MAAPTSPFDLDTTASNNQPPASEGLSSGDDQIRALAACVKQLVVKGADIASAGTITPAATASFFDVTGTTTITAIGSSASWDGRVVWLQFDGALTLTHSSTLNLPGAVNYTTAAGDVLAFVQETSGTWRCVSATRAASQVVAFSARRATSSQTSGSTIIFNAEDYDSHNAYNTTTGEFTVPVAGVYMLSFNVTFSYNSGAGTSNNSFNLAKNGTTIFESYVNADSGAIDTASLSVVVSLAANDVMKVVFSSTLSASDSVLVGTTAGATFFSGAKIN